MIVSNSAGTLSDPTGADADLLEKATGVKVLRHNTKVMAVSARLVSLLSAFQKPGCSPEIMAYFRSQTDSGVTSPSQVAIVGDRLFTDVMMANMMGSYGFWIREGAVTESGLVSTGRIYWERVLTTIVSLCGWRRSLLAICSDVVIPLQTLKATSSKPW